MSARYLVRFDDVCPTMKWATWDRVEAILDRHGVKPILAVVPDNADPELVADRPDPAFWSRVRAWQARGWTIAFHGHRHAYVTRDAGLVGLNARSEFAGLPYGEQKAKIEAALAIFAREQVTAEAWIAPGHSFDETTVRVLVEAGTNVISDGFFFRPLRKLGATWIPQQLWRFRRVPFGVWTVCLHANAFTDRDLDNLDRDLGRFRESIVSLPEILREDIGRETLLDAAFSKFWLWMVQRRRARSSSE
jgi:predicted deacetylase